MDPTQAIGVAEKLARGDAQLVLAFVAVGGVAAATWAIWKVIHEIKACGAERTELALKSIDAQHRMSDALDRNSDVMKAGLEALKRQ